MKRYFFISTFVVALSITGFSQKEVAPPVSAKASFEKSFAGSSKVKWEKEGAGYEVNFVQNGQEMSAVFNSKGVLQETETEIKQSELPAAASDYVKQHYKGGKIKETAKITKANGEVNYEVNINGKDVMFDSHGKHIKDVKEPKD